jgi:hypothetical protein
MDNKLPAFLALALAAVMAVVAFTCMCFPNVMQRLNPSNAASTYRKAGCLLAVGSILMLALALFLLSLRGRFGWGA